MKSITPALAGQPPAVPTLPGKRSIYLPAARRLPPVSVLVVLHGDNFIEVYGPEHVRVAIVNRLDADADANLVDKYMEMEIPRAHQAIYMPSNLRGRGTIERRTTRTEADRLDRLAALKMIQGGKDR